MIQDVTRTAVAMEQLSKRAQPWKRVVFYFVRAATLAIQRRGKHIMQPFWRYIKINK
jgi:hypothetical protein